jgi:hypothetical protein
MASLSATILPGKSSPVVLLAASMFLHIEEYGPADA